MAAVERHRSSKEDLGPPPVPSNTQSLPVPPNQREAERSVIGGLLINGKQFETVLGLIKKEDFYDFKHQIAFAAMQSLFEKHEEIDLLTVKDFLERQEKLNDIGGIGYLAEIAHETPSASNVASYARIVRDHAILRSLLQGCNEIRQIVFAHQNSSVNDVLSRAQQVMFDLGREYDNNPDLIHIRDASTAAFKRIEELHEDPNKSSITGIPTGFADLDELTSGFQRSDLVIIAGRPSMGKTALAMNIAEHAAVKKGLNVIIFSLEMPAIQLSMRSLSSLSSIDSKIIREGDMGEGEEGRDNWKRLAHALNLLQNASIYIDATPGISPLQISAVSRRMAREHKLDMIVVDYLQLLQIKDDQSNRATELAKITRELKFLAKELDVPVIALSQLNREVEGRPNKRPMMADLRESGAIEQDADLILFVYREEMYKPDTTEHGVAEIIISKHRNGDTGTVKLTFMKEYTRFENFANDPQHAASGHDIAYD